MANVSDSLSWSRFYVPEVHDLHPGMLGRLDALAEFFPADARPSIAWLVVPNWAGREPIDADFAARVGALGGDLVLHGYTHLKGPSAFSRLLYGHDDPKEFAGIGAAEARERISVGLLETEAAFGVRPDWFCAPSWRQSEATGEAVAQCNMRGFHLADRLVTAEGEAIDLPAVNFDVGERAAWHALSRIPRRAQIDRLLRAGRPFRFTLHPGDLDHPATWRQAEALMARLDNEGWRPVSMDGAVALWRSRPDG